MQRLNLFTNENSPEKDRLCAGFPKTDKGPKGLENLIKRLLSIV